MRKYMFLVILAVNVFHIPSSGQIVMRKEEEKAAKKEAKKEQKDRKKTQKSDKKKNKKLEKKLNRKIRNGTSDLPS